MIKKVIGCYANGRLGSLVMKGLLEKGYEVDLLVRNPDSSRVLELKSLGATIIPFDFQDFEALQSRLCDNCCIYVGGPFGKFSELIDFVQANEAQITRAVFVSSANAKVGDYESYRKFEDYEDLVLHKLSVGLVIKPTLIFGVHDDGNFGFVASWLARHPVFPIVGTGKTIYQPVHYEDLRDAIISGFEKDKLETRSFLIGGRDRIPYLDIVHQIKKLIGTRSVTISIPKGVMLFVSRLVGKFIKLPLSREQIRRVDVDRDVDISPAIEELNYSPQPFDSRLKQAVESYKVFRDSSH